jgi:hypothetical protein
VRLTHSPRSGTSPHTPLSSGQNKQHSKQGAHNSCPKCSGNIGHTLQRPTASSAYSWVAQAAACVLNNTPLFCTGSCGITARKLHRQTWRQGANANLHHLSLGAIRCARVAAQLPLCGVVRETCVRVRVQQAAASGVWCRCGDTVARLKWWQRVCAQRCAQRPASWCVCVVGVPPTTLLSNCHAAPSHALHVLAAHCSTTTFGPTGVKSVLQPTRLSTVAHALVHHTAHATHHVLVQRACEGLGEGRATVVDVGQHSGQQTHTRVRHVRARRVGVFQNRGWQGGAPCARTPAACQRRQRPPAHSMQPMWPCRAAEAQRMCGCSARRVAPACAAPVLVSVRLCVCLRPVAVLHAPSSAFRQHQLSPATEGVVLDAVD